MAGPNALTVVTYDAGLPVDSLPPGEYPLTVAVSAGEKHDECRVRFTVE